MEPANKGHLRDCPDIVLIVVIVIVFIRFTKVNNCIQIDNI